jgi:hypothetical protein
MLKPILIGSAARAGNGERDEREQRAGESTEHVVPPRMASVRCRCLVLFAET